MAMASLRLHTAARAPAAPLPCTAVERQVASGFEFEAMSSRCEIRLAGADSGRLAVVAQQAIDEVRRIEAKYSRYRSQSVVGRINAGAGAAAAVEIDPETTSLLNFAAQLHSLSDGLFDITSGLLRRAWDFKAARRPAAGEIEALLPLIGWQKVERSATGVRLPLAGMEIDFGGFGKEYAADRAAAVLLRQGQRHGFVNLGGDIRVLGPRPDGRAWRFAIQHPREPEGCIASLELQDGALATSGDYDRHFEADGQRYCHILDPRTGWPVQGWQSVSVTAPACVAAGALTTIAMLKGAQALAWLRAQGAGYLAVDSQGLVHRDDADDHGSNEPESENR